MSENFPYESNTDISLKLKAVIDTAIDGIMTIDDKGVVEGMNPAAARLFGYPSEEVIGKNIRMLMPSPDREQHDSYIQRYIQTRHPRIIGIGREVTGRRKDGSTFAMRLAVSEVVLENRRIFTGIIHDLSGVKAAEEKVRKLNEKLEDKVMQRTEELANVVNKLLETNHLLQHEIAERKAAEKTLRERELEIREALKKEKELSDLKSRFVSMASHEFRTPLSTILSSVSLIGRYTEPGLEEKREKHIKRIKSAVRNLTGILNDFLSLSKLEEGKIENNPSLFVLQELFAEVIDEMEGLLKPGQKIVDEEMIAEPLHVLMDQRLLRNILFNLLSNAIKYSGEHQKIRCCCSLEGETILLEVRDEGIGIPKEEQQYLFTRFFRATNSTNIQGTGLGLNIVRRYVELIGGSITFESKLEEGTTFFVRLPVKPKE